MLASLLVRLGTIALAGALDISVARAESTSPNAAQRAEAEAHYAQGAAAYQAGRYHQAVEQFLTADRIAPSAALSFNAARAYEKLGDPARALEFYRDYLRRGAKDDLGPRVEKRVAELEKILKARGIQQLSIFSDPEGAEIHVDGRLLGTTPKTLELAPGTHALTLRKDGYIAAKREVDLRAEDALDVSVTLSSAPPQLDEDPSRNQPEQAARERRSTGIGPGPWVTMGLGGAALVGAGVFEMLRRSAQEDAQSTPQAEFSEYEDRVDRARAHQTTARVLTATGGVLVIVGGVWGLLDVRSQERQPTTTAIACGKSSCFGSLKVTF